MKRVVTGTSLLSICVAIVGQCGAGERYERFTGATVMIADPVDDLWGTGSLIDKQRSLVATAYHVVDAIGRWYQVFPHLTTEGRVWTHDEYISSFSDLNERELAGTGVVVAFDSEKDLAILYVPGLPEWMSELEIASDGVDEGDFIDYCGHPDGRDRFTYSVGRILHAMHDSWYYKDGHYVDANVVRFLGQSYGGFSGSPILNWDGQLVGVLSGSNGSEGIVTAIASGELQSLLSTVEFVHAAAVYNEADITLYFAVRESEDSDWEAHEIRPGSGLVFWNEDDGYSPEVRFDWTYADYSPDYDEVRYTLPTSVGVSGSGTNPEIWASKYSFKPVEGGINLFKSE